MVLSPTNHPTSRDDGRLQHSPSPSLLQPLEMVDDFNILAIFLPLLLSSTLFHLVSAAGDTISPNQSIADGQTLISSGGFFALGFFAPAGSEHRYVGIWFHNIPLQTVVWVANRATPITGSGGVLHLTADGNLIVHNHTGDIFWSTATSGVTAQLLDSGNLVVLNESKGIVWQSFDHPSDTLLPGMKLGWDLRTHLDRCLVSWKTTSDPSPGAYSVAMDIRGSPEMYMWNGSVPRSRTGPWDGQSLGGTGPTMNNDVFTHRFVANDDEVYCVYDTLNKSVKARLVVTQLGFVQRLLWIGEEWKVYWSEPADPCSLYGQCGVYGVCNSAEFPICKCLNGFVPKSTENWNVMRVESGGCVRRTRLSCPVGDGFLKMTVKLPDTSNATVGKYLSLDKCRDGCLKNCSCTAFAFLGGGSGCIAWHGNLIDIREQPLGDGDDLYVRLAASELPLVVGRRRNVLMIVTITIPIALVILITIMRVMWKRRNRYKGMRKVPVEQPLFTLDTNLANKLGESPYKNLEFTLFQFSTIVDATDNFSDANKLGMGGFGPVYKGELPDGREIAVKRLAAHSGQGLDEFKNEILLIARLQHRNLVKLLGCCIHEEEKILIYEYMPNKSLDFFLFDPSKREQLDWCKRFCIIEGIAQGLLYLHKHSRVRIIHRDLKASNILLDDEMNPKISDFGMARIFGSNEIQANTKKVVGTYGYISPEYAAEGLFSIKSDVFSFGVIILEIVTGNRNTNFYQYGDSFNLLGHVWQLWKTCKWLESVDPSFDGRYNVIQISRCIHVALLCVQESPTDRPTISDVITMMSNESIALPNPKQPAFFNVRIASEENLLSKNSKINSLNNVTITNIDGR